MFWYFRPCRGKVQQPDAFCYGGSLLGIGLSNSIVVLKDRHALSPQLLRVLLAPFTRPGSIFTADGIITQLVEIISVFLALYDYDHAAGQVPGHIKTVRYALAVVYPFAFFIRPPPRKRLVRLPQLLNAVWVCIDSHDFRSGLWGLLRIIEQITEFQSNTG